MKKSIRIKREYIIGLVVLIVFSFFLWGVSFLKNGTFFHKRVEFIGVYNRVSGLLKDNPVLISGLKVGKVIEMGLLPNTFDKVYIKILMLEKVDIPSNSTMKVVSSDLLGAKSVEIIPGNSKTFAKSGDTLKTIISKSLKDEVSMEVLPLKMKAEQLISSFDSLIKSVHSILDENTRENLRRSIESIRYALKNIETISYNVDTLMGSEKVKISRMLTNIESFSNNLKANNAKLNNIINNFSTFSDTLAKANVSNTLKTAEKAFSDISEITDKIKKGKGSLGLLLNNDSLYTNLNNSSDALNKLLVDLKQNPKRYVHVSVFGGGKDKSKDTPKKK